MNYYELREFKGLNISQLLDSFNSEKTIRAGSISVYEDSIGKPGDMTFALKKISLKDGKLIFNFNENDKIILSEPNHIVINDKVIGIQKSKEISWIFKDMELKYYLDSDFAKIRTKVISGVHNFRINESSASFLFYSW